MEQYYSYYILRFISRLSNFNSPSSCIRLGWHYVVINSSSQMWPFMFKKLESSFMDPCHKASLLNTNFRSFRACLSNSAAFMSSQLATSVRNSRPLINLWLTSFLVKNFWPRFSVFSFLIKFLTFYV